MFGLLMEDSLAWSRRSKGARGSILLWYWVVYFGSYSTVLRLITINFNYE